MADEVKPNGPLPAVVEPYVNLFHTVGLPWFIIIAASIYVYPIAIKSLASLDRLNEHAVKAMPLLEKAAEAVPLLEQLNKTNIQSARQRHGDMEDLKASIPQKVD